MPGNQQWANWSLQASFLETSSGKLQLTMPCWPEPMHPPLQVAQTPQWIRKLSLTIQGQTFRPLVVPKIHVLCHWLGILSDLHLLHLHLFNLGVNDDAMAIISETVAHLPSLQEAFIDLDGNYITSF